LSSEQCRIEFNLYILEVFDLSRDTCIVIRWLYHLSLSLDFLGAAQAKVRSETHFLFSRIFSIPFR